MKLTKKQRISLAVLAVGLVGLAIDRVFLLPQSATGEPVRPVDQATERTVVEEENTGDDQNSSTVVESLSDRFDALWADRKFDPCNMRDAFSLPSAWHGDQTASGSSKPDAVTLFARGHNLNATFVNGQLSHVLVDGRSVPLGGKLDGFRLVRISDASATFEADGRTVILKLRETDNRGPKN